MTMPHIPPMILGAFGRWCPSTLLVGAAMVSGMMACGVGEDAAIPGTAEKQDVVRIGRLICGGHLTLAIVERRYQDQLEGFKLETVQNHDWITVAKELESGGLAGTFILSPLAMELIRDGLPAKIVLMGDRNGNGFVLSNKLESIGGLADRKAVLAVPHIYSQHNVLLHLLLEQHGVPLDLVSVIGMPPRDMINSLRRGEIDGFMVGEPEGNKSVTLGVGWMASISPDIWANHLDHVLVVTDRFIAEHPDELQQLVNQLVRAGQFIERNPDQAAALGEDYTGSRASVFETVLTTPPDWIDFGDMVPTAEDFRTMATRLVKMGLWDEVPENVDHYLDTRFVKRASGRVWKD